MTVSRGNRVATAKPVVTGDDGDDDSARNYIRKRAKSEKLTFKEGENEEKEAEKEHAFVPQACQLRRFKTWAAD